MVVMHEAIENIEAIMNACDGIMVARGDLGGEISLELVEDTHDTDEMFAKTAKAALDAGFVTVGDLAVLTAGHPIRIKGTTNMLKVKKL